MAGWNKSQMADRFLRSRDSYADKAVVQRMMGEELLKLLLLGTEKSEYRKIFEIGCGGGEFTAGITGQLGFEKLILNDISHCLDVPSEFEYIHGDAEEVAFPEECDLIISNAALQWVSDFTPFVRKVADALKNGGIFAFSAFGEENFRELRLLGAPSLRYLTKAETLDAMEKANFEILAFSEYLQVLYFSDAISILRHFKNTGVTAIGAGAYRSRGKLEKLLSEYEKRFTDNSGVALTYHPRLIVARKPA